MNYPSFFDAQKLWQKQLAKYQWPINHAWINQEETIYLGGLYYIIENDQTNDPDRIKREYEIAINHPYGIMFSAICANENMSYCYFYVPKNEQEAKLKSINEKQVKLFVPTIKTPYLSVKNAVQAELLKSNEKKYLRWKAEKF